MYKLIPMTEEYAKLISTWRYPGEYAIYSFDGSEEDIAELMCGEYLACIGGDALAGDAPVGDALAGYFCFGGAATIPCESRYASDLSYIDIGLGMKPALCGMGLGHGFLQAGIEYARTSFRAKGLRLAVAQFNKRAIALYKASGFSEAGTVTHLKSLAPFYIMKLEF